jgi:hypothetical protein
MGGGQVAVGALRISGPSDDRGNFSLADWDQSLETLLSKLKPAATKGTRSRR